MSKPITNKKGITGYITNICIAHSHLIPVISTADDNLFKWDVNFFIMQFSRTLYKLYSTYSDSENTLLQMKMTSLQCKS